jgi:ketosteroid isomerase-like protein
MSNQITSWNNGDIDAYMDFYWKSDSLQFIGSKGLNYGWDTTLMNYKKSYSSKEKMGELEFSNLNCKDLENNSFLINGKWHLKRNDELKDLKGYYTLIWKKINGQWKIVYDHSS